MIGDSYHAHFYLEASDGPEAGRELIRKLDSAGTTIECSVEDGWVTFTAPAVFMADLVSLSGLVFVPPMPDETHEVTLHVQVRGTVTKEEYDVLVAEQPEKAKINSEALHSSG
jgi:hypothetical protein